MHDFWNIALGDPVLLPFPLDPISTVLDIGYGTGKWVDQVAYEYQESTVVGVDIAPLIEEDQNFETNCQFYIGNVLDRTLAFEEAPFDLIQSRSMAMGIPHALWPTYVAK